MAVTIDELIKRREELQARKADLFDVETSIGTLTCRIPSAGLVAEAWDMKNSADGNAYLILQCCVEPNLKDRELLKTFKCSEPHEIATEIFLPGEVAKIAGHLLKLAGFEVNITSKIHNAVKN